MTPAVDYKKALEALDKLYAHSLPTRISTTGFNALFNQVQQALQPCAEAMTEDELAKAVTEFIEEMDYDPSNYALEVPALKRALAKSGHLKVKA